MYKIKKIVRDGILETNSSSSHSVCISRNGSLSRPGDRVWDLDIRDGVLYIPEPLICFGRNDFKSNRCLLKIQYAYGLALQTAPREQYRITEVLKKVTGVREVSIAWVENYKKKMKETFNNFPEIYVNTPEIDHQSLDLSDDILESEETIKNFIFNPNSWLYGGSDESEPEPGFKNECITRSEDDYRAKLVVHLGGSFGDVEFILEDFINESIYSIDREKIQGLYWDEETDDIKFQSFSREEEVQRRFFWRSKYEKNPDTIPPELVFDENNNIFLLIFPLLSTDLVNAFVKPDPNNKITIEDIKKVYPEMKLKIFPAELISEKYGKLL